MAEFKHLVLAKFKQDVVVDDVLKDLQNLASEIETVKSFSWGQDIESDEILRQGFTHAFLLTFESKEDLAAYYAHPKHLQFVSTFSSAIDKVIALDFPAINLKPAAAA